MSRGMSKGSCGLRKSLGSMSADEWGCCLPCWCFGLSCPSIGSYRLLGGSSSCFQNGSLNRHQKKHLKKNPTVSHKNTPESEDRVNLSQHNKGHYNREKKKFLIGRNTSVYILSNLRDVSTNSNKGVKEIHT